MLLCIIGPDDVNVVSFNRAIKYHHGVDVEGIFIPFRLLTTCMCDVLKVKTYIFFEADLESHVVNESSSGGFIYYDVGWYYECLH